MLRAIIFDCDGVLFDSHRANIEFFNAVITAAGQPRLDAAGERMATSMAGSQLIQGLFGHDPALVEHIRVIAREFDYDPFFAWMDPAPNLHDLLASLRTRFRLAMATNRGITVPQVIQRFDLGKYIEYAVGVLDVPRPKPFPDMLLKCTEHFEIAPSEALYVGDASTDREAAIAAGMHFLGVREHTGADRWIPDLQQLETAIDSIIGESS